MINKSDRVEELKMTHYTSGCDVNFLSKKIKPLLRPHADQAINLSRPSLKAAPGVERMHQSLLPWAMPPRPLGTRFYDHNFREPSPIQFDVRRPIKTTAPTISFSWTASKTLV
ncbi:hypothetical protein CDAR_452401 [Caerostris darwini]|uniref:Uncharacterized protein n=1 Tax=Caerostris darwini TaxID=1538125 RepID=A0AAV4VQB2_9ARAC|nr:hypothetical protein CDAR_452401 [Caerostris darwini]